MPTQEQIKEAARRRKANQRARDKGMPEPYPELGMKTVDEAQKSLREKEHFDNLSWAEQQDLTGRFYKSECRSAVSLLAIYEGNNNVGVEEVEDIDRKTGKKKNNSPTPFNQKIQIRAIELDGVKIDPNNTEHRKTYEIDHVVPFMQWLELRDKARKDLFWLGRLLGRSFFHNTHKEICDAFVKKNFDGMYFPDCTFDDVHEMIGNQKRFAADGTETRTLLLFAPRSGYKSTADGVDTVQWMLNCPDVRIMIMTSVRDLSLQLMGEIKGYFYLPPRGKPTAFQILFPEYVLTGVDGRSEQPITCPAQILDSKEPHVWITSLDSSFVGQRCDIRKLDDIVEDKNSATEELRKKLKEKVKSTNALVEPWGFTDVIGTRYFTTDWYGWRMGLAPDDDETEAVEPFVYLCISCWTPKPGFEVVHKLLLEEPNGIFKITEDMVDLWFPYKLHWKALKTKLREYKERGFKNQYLNIATDPMEESSSAVHFDIDTLRRHTYPQTSAPTEGDLVITVDYAYSERQTSDFSVLVANLVVTREDRTQEVVVLEIVPGKWKGSELAEQIALFLRKWGSVRRIHRIIIEKALGADILMELVRLNCIRYGCVDVLYRLSLEQPVNEANAKANRIKGLEILLSEDRLWFVSGPWIDETYKQFTRFTGETKSGRKDDIPDAVSYVTKCLSRRSFHTVSQDPLKQKEDMEREQEEERRKANYDRYFGPQHYMPQPQAMEPSQSPPVVDQRQALLGRVFGGNGLRA